MSLRISVVTPTIPPRRPLLERCELSVKAQTLPPLEWVVEMDDIDRMVRGGAGVTRTRAMRRAVGDWIAFLDDDDELLPHHLARCAEVQADTDADVVVPWFRVVGGFDPFPANRELPIDPADMHSFGITCLVRREAIGDIGFDVQPWPEDFYFWKALGAAGATFVKLPEVTWIWHHHGRNTSGKGDAW